MANKMESTKDTIAALATPTGLGALAIIRISGELAKSIVKEVFIPAKNRSLKPRELQLGWIQIDNKKIDQAMAVYMPSPNSYTGEDIVELHLHGSPAIINLVLSYIVNQPNTRQAQPGEFTQRAFLNGKIDLIQAEAVAELISAQNKRSAKQATQLLNGALSKQIETLKSQIISLSAYYIANLDFSEEDIPSISSVDAKKIILTTQDEITLILQNARHQNIIREGFKVALVGLPNAGKSTLLNSLLGYDRALVTDIAGTTRDVLTESITVNGINFVLTDTAGLHNSKDRVEKLGIERTKQEITHSDIILLLIEPGKQLDTEKYLSDNGLTTLLNPEKTLVVFSKSDTSLQSPKKFFTKFSTLSINAKDKNLIKSVTDSLQVFTQDIRLDSVTLLTNRQLQLFRDAKKQLTILNTLLQNNVSDDIVLVELQSLVEIFNKLSGKQTSTEMISEVFSNFCIGK